MKNKRNKNILILKEVGKHYPHMWNVEKKLGGRHPCDMTKLPPPELPRISRRPSASYPAQSHRSAQIRNFSNATYYITGVNQSHIKISKAFPSLTFVAVLATAYVRVRLAVCVHLLPARACVCDKTLTLEPFPITVCNKYYFILAFRNLEESYTRINIHDIFFSTNTNHK